MHIFVIKSTDGKFLVVPNGLNRRPKGFHVTDNKGLIPSEMTIHMKYVHDYKTYLYSLNNEKAWCLLSEKLSQIESFSILSHISYLLSKVSYYEDPLLLIQNIREKFIKNDLVQDVYPINWNPLEIVIEMHKFHQRNNYLLSLGKRYITLYNPHKIQIFKCLRACYFEPRYRDLICFDSFSNTIWNCIMKDYSQMMNSCNSGE